MNDAVSKRRRLVLQQASEWIVRLQDDPLSDADLESWARWMSESKDHAEAFDDLTALWEASANLDSESILRARKEGPPVAGVATQLQNRPSRQRRRRPLMRWMGAAAAAAVVVVGLWLLMPVREVTPDVQHFATAQGERNQFTLPDGSEVSLDAATEIQVKLTDARREVVLQSGQAFFAVAHAPDRPFVVMASQVEARALGTRFSVSRHASDAVSVSVLEGRVRVSAPASSGRSGTWFDAGMGQRIDYAQAQGLSAPKQTNVELATAWRDGIVIYQGERLANVIADLNRYSKVPVRLDDPVHGQLKVTGRWELDKTEGWLEGLAQALGLSALRHRNEIVLTSRARPESDAPVVEPTP